MSLSERLAAFTPVAKNQCHTCAWYDSQTDEDKAAFNGFISLIDAGKVSRTQVLREFQEEGLTIGQSSFGRHLNTCREPH